MDILCRQCGKTLRIPDNTEGKTIRCPNCDFRFTLQAGMVTPVAPPVDSSVPVSEFQQNSSSAYSPNGNPTSDQEYAPNRSSVPPRERFAPTGATFLQQRTLFATKVDLVAVISDSWRLFSDNLGKIMGAFLLFFLMWFIAYVPYLIIKISEEIYIGLPEMSDMAIFLQFILFGYSILFSLTVAWLSIGLFRYFLTVARGEEASFSLLFTGANALWRTIILQLYYILIFIATVVVMMIVVLPTVALTSETLSHDVSGLFVLGVGSLVFFALMFVLFRLFLTYILILDTGIRTWESLKVSWTVMRGNCVSLFLLFLFASFVVLMGVLCFCIGYLFALPYIQLLMAVFYLHATGQAKSIPEPEGKQYL